MRKTEVMHKSLQTYVPNFKDLSVFIFFVCNVGQNDPIPMKRKIVLSCHLSNVCAKFQIDNS